MAINNSNKPIGANAGQGQTVGSDYASRKQWSSNNISAEPQIQRPKDFFGVKANEINPVETFESNAKFTTRQVSSSQVIKALEAGKKVKPKISDNAFLKFLDNVIAAPGDNVSPQVAKASTKTQVKSIGKVSHS